ncbi:MAG: hypothetical protein HY245_15785 [Rhizobiales bacterium]|nr:hypothetical protein [Hyphomicrobiales bacterium]MBI3674844.1 hypothetical protein [Hyphomicrobiales bacterium]
MRPANFVWYDVMTPDMKGAEAFYTNVIGFSAKDSGMPGPMWTRYWDVDAGDAAVARAKSSGATLLNGPMQVPGGIGIANLADPQGAMFNVLSLVR